MESVYRKINTEVGYIEAKRDAIYLDSFEQHGSTHNVARQNIVGDLKV